ncbi:hypothetical protein B0H10DRAFT_1970066 [Mycena sp. CBHHK59/15]|nr:hypothetical protein B0H10DRAFT_1970066 [Mycena sp. CBHHK59/15]
MAIGARKPRLKGSFPLFRLFLVLFFMASLFLCPAPSCGSSSGSSSALSRHLKDCTAYQNFLKSSVAVTSTAEDVPELETQDQRRIRKQMEANIIKKKNAKAARTLKERKERNSSAGLHNTAVAGPSQPSDFPDILMDTSLEDVPFDYSLPDGEGPAVCSGKPAIE